MSSAGSESLAFGSHCSANSPPILDCFIPSFNLKYEDSENIKTDRVNTVVLTTSNPREECFWDTWYIEHFTLRFVQHQPQSAQQTECQTQLCPTSVYYLTSVALVKLSIREK